MPPLFKTLLANKLIKTSIIALFFAILSLQPLAQAETKVLNYDKYGNIIGSKTYQQDKRSSGSKSVPQQPGASTFDPDTAYESGVLILSDPPSGYARKIRAKGFLVIERVTLYNLGMSLVRVQIPTQMNIKEAMRTLGRLLPGVSIDTNTQFYPSGQQSLTRNSFVNRQTANPRMMAGWQNLSATCGKGLRLGQIDSGVALSHPALKGQDIIYRAFNSPRRFPAPAGHGTSIAAMLVGTQKWGGLVPGATLYAANMFEINEYGKMVGSAVGLLKAIDWLMSKKVHAVNLSIAGSDNKLIRKAFDVAKKHNLILVASVGNWGRSDKPAFPAAYSHVLAITAIKEDGRIYIHANTGSYVDFAAPGVGIFTATPNGRGKAASGTSYSVPYITVMAAILNRGGKAPTVSVLRNILKGATMDLGKPGKDNVFGFGKIKARPVCKS
ncbi:MAG: S8 family serine peptidase [Magnetovibrio sp.]|nr:S8 family serine peptidase [Magnetovibrio sp.]